MVVAPRRQGETQTLSNRDYIQCYREVLISKVGSSCLLARKNRASSIQVEKSSWFFQLEFSSDPVYRGVSPVFGPVPGLVVALTSVPGLVEALT